MSEIRKKGWHPDPFGIHHERYYYLDDQPGRLVRDSNRRESYDEIRGPAVQVEPGAKTEITLSTVPTAVISKDDGDPRLDTPASPPNATFVPPLDGSFAFGHESAHPFGNPTFQDDPVRWRTLIAERALRVARSVPKLKKPNLALPHVSRRGWAALGAASIVAVAALLAVLLSGPSKGRPTTNQQTASRPPVTHPLVVPGNFLNAAGWSVSEVFPTSALSLNGVDCPTPANCFTVGETSLLSGLVLGSSDGGASWHQQAVPAGVGALTSISCASASTCVAVGGITVISTIDGGSTWTVQFLGHNVLTSIACPSVSVCVATGDDALTTSGCNSGSSYTTHDGGVTWATTPLACFEPTDIACPDSVRCELVGEDDSTSTSQAEILGSSDAGAQWQAQLHSTVDGSVLRSVSCPSALRCEAAGTLNGHPIVGTTNGGRSWSAQVVPPTATHDRFDAIACQSALVCQAGGTQNVSTSDGGSTWNLTTWPAPVDDVTSISCPLVATCVAAATTASRYGLTLRYSL